MSNIPARTGLHASAPYTVTISCYLQATTNESNHRAHRVHRGRTETSRQNILGTFEPLPILNHVTTIH